MPDPHAEIDAMHAAGKFSIKEIAYASGWSEWDVARYLAGSRIRRTEPTGNIVTRRPHVHTSLRD